MILDRKRTAGHAKMLANLWRPSGEVRSTKDKVRSAKPLITFAFFLPDQNAAEVSDNGTCRAGVSGKVKAKNRCDARSAIKKLIGIPRKHRLPVDVEILKTEH